MLGWDWSAVLWTDVLVGTFFERAIVRHRILGETVITERTAPGCALRASREIPGYTSSKGYSGCSLLQEPVK